MKQKNTKLSSRQVQNFLWDAWCACSIVGIWPRFIEPYMVGVTHLSLQVPTLPPTLKGTKIVQFSDLHLHPGVPDFFLKKIIEKVHSLQPDIIVFTGDFICFSNLVQQNRLNQFLCSFSAPHGCFAVLGNHDYERPVAVNSEGEYDIATDSTSVVAKGVKRVLSTVKLAKKTTERAKAIGKHQELVELIQKTPFQLLDNRSKLIPIKDSQINIVGVGEYTLGKFTPEKAFQEYKKQYPGIILAHNPDTIPLLKEYPGDVILCGHTHGGQVNLPWVWRKLTLLENMEYKYGLFHPFNKWAYVSRGVGSVLPFRWFAMPEIVSINLE